MGAPPRFPCRRGASGFTSVRFVSRHALLLACRVARCALWRFM